MSWKTLRRAKWQYIVRGLALGTFGLGVLWHDTAMVVAGLGAAAAPIHVEKQS